MVVTPYLCCPVVKHQGEDASRAQCDDALHGSPWRTRPAPPGMTARSRIFSLPFLPAWRASVCARASHRRQGAPGARPASDRALSDGSSASRAGSCAATHARVPCPCGLAVQPRRAASPGNVAVQPRRTASRRPRRTASACMPSYRDVEGVVGAQSARPERKLQPRTASPA